jgi:hypothetical protein
VRLAAFGMICHVGNRMLGNMIEVNINVENEVNHYEQVCIILSVGFDHAIPDE